MATKRKRIDWEAVERDYRIGKLTGDEMEKKHGCRRLSIVRKAKKLGWERDLSHVVRSATNAALMAKKAAEIGKEIGENIVAGVAEVVTGNVRIVTRHQNQIDETSGVVNSLVKELKTVTDPEILELLHEEIAQIENPKRRAVMESAVSLGNRAGAALKLAASMKTLIELERQAHGITAEKPEENGVTVQIVSYDGRPTSE